MKLAGLKRERTLQALTQEELSQMSGLTVETISRLEHERFAPRAATVKALAAALDVQPRRLYGE